MGSGNKSDFKRLTKPSGNNVEATYEGCVKLTTVVRGSQKAGFILHFCVKFALLNLT